MRDSGLELSLPKLFVYIGIKTQTIFAPGLIMVQLMLSKLLQKPNFLSILR